VIVREMLERTIQHSEALSNGNQPPNIKGSWFKTTAELFTPFKLMYDSLMQTGNKLLARGKLLNIIRRFGVWGLEFRVGVGGWGLGVGGWGLRVGDWGFGVGGLGFAPVALLSSVCAYHVHETECAHSTP
jgi:hypothetical protein